MRETLNDGIDTMFVPFMGVIVVILLAYFGLHWLLKKQKRITSGRYIKVMERTMLSQDKSLLLVETAGRVYLLGVTGQGISKIDDFDPRSLPPKEPPRTADFGTILSSLTNSMRQKDHVITKKDGTE